MRRTVPSLLILALLSCSAEPEPVPAQVQTGSGLVEASTPSVSLLPAPPPRIAPREYSLSGPYSQGNLGIFFVERPDARAGDESLLSLEEALASGGLKITEKSQGAQVNKLEVENTGLRPVYLQAGDTVKGGRQDRTIGVDFILPPHSGKQDIEAFCVEPSRWSPRSIMDADLQIATASVAFEAAPAPVATKEQKLAIKEAHDQSQVWKAGGVTNALLASQAGAGFSAKESYVLAAEAPEIQKKLSAYVDALLPSVEGKPRAVGMAFAVNGELSTVEIYRTTGLFRKLWPKLLRGAALEALAKEKPGSAPPGPKAADFEQLLDEAGQAKGTQRILPGEIRLKSYASAKVALFDTEVEGELLHRQLIRK